MGTPLKRHLRDMRPYIAASGKDATMNASSFILCLCAGAWIAGALPVCAQTAEADFQQAVTAYQQAPAAATVAKVSQLTAARP